MRMVDLMHALHNTCRALEVCRDRRVGFLCDIKVVIYFIAKNYLNVRQRHLARTS